MGLGRFCLVGWLEPEHVLKTKATDSTAESPMTINACGPSQDQVMTNVLQRDGDPSPASQDIPSKDSLRKKPNEDHVQDDLQPRAPQKTGESPMTINACGPSQDHVKSKNKSRASTC